MDRAAQASGRAGRAEASGRVVRWAACAMIALLAWGVAPVRAQWGPSPVHADPARLETIEQRRMVTGELRALRRSLVAVEEPGIVRELGAREGHPVREGEVLAQLDASRLEIELETVQRELAQAEAAIEEERALADYWSAEVAAMEDAKSRGASNESELRNARAQERVASARVARAGTSVEVVRSRAALLRKRIDDMTVRAPFDGVVVRRDAEAGMWMGEGDTLLELVATGTLEVWLDVPQRLLAVVSRAGLEVSARSDATGEETTVEGARVVPDVNRTTRTFQVVGRLKNEDGAWAAGSSVVGFVPTGEPGELLTISRDAVLRNEAGAFVYVARPGEEGAWSAAPAMIEVLYQAGQRLAIRPGAIQAGDLVITEGAERLFPMSPVVVVERGAPLAGASGDGEAG